MDFTASLAQIKPKLGCLHENLATIEDNIARARKAGSDLVVFPELALTGYFLKDLVPDIAISLDSPEISRLKKLSKDIAIAVGFVEATSDYRFFNSSVFLDRGEIVHVHRKVYLPTYGLFDEQRYLARGDRLDRKSVVWGKSVNRRVDLGGRLSLDRKSTRLNSSHQSTSRMPSSA